MEVGGRLSSEEWAEMPEFAYTDLLPMGEDTTPYRLVTSEGVSTFEADGRTFLKVEPEALRKLATEAIHDIQHYLRPAHLAQWRWTC
jgi:fumarate hydratase, class I